MNRLQFAPSHVHALRALQACNLLEQRFGSMGRAQSFARNAMPLLSAPTPAPSAAPFLGQDFLGQDYLGADALMGLDSALSMLGADQLAALLGAEAAEAFLGGRRHRRGVPPVPAVDRHGYLPIPATAVPTLSPTAVINIFPQAQGGIQLTRLIVPSDQGTRWLINDVTVATRSQFFAPGSISAVMCSEVQTYKLKGDVAMPGTIVAISVTNISGADQTLQGAAFLAEAREARAI